MELGYELGYGSVFKYVNMPVGRQVWQVFDRVKSDVP